MATLFLVLAGAALAGGALWPGPPLVSHPSAPLSLSNGSGDHHRREREATGMPGEGVPPTYPPRPPPRSERAPDASGRSLVHPHHPETPSILPPDNAHAKTSIWQQTTASTSSIPLRSHRDGVHPIPAAPLDTSFVPTDVHCTRTANCRAKNLVTLGHPQNQPPPRAQPPVGQSRHRSQNPSPRLPSEREAMDQARPGPTCSSFPPGSRPASCTIWGRDPAPARPRRLTLPRAGPRQPTLASPPNGDRPESVLNRVSISSQAANTGPAAQGSGPLSFSTRTTWFGPALALGFWRASQLAKRRERRRFLPTRRRGHPPRLLASSSTYRTRVGDARETAFLSRSHSDTSVASTSTDPPALRLLRPLCNADILPVFLHADESPRPAHMDLPRPAPVHRPTGTPIPVGQGQQGMGLRTTPLRRAQGHLDPATAGRATEDPSARSIRSQPRDHRGPLEEGLHRGALVPGTLHHPTGRPSLVPAPGTPVERDPPRATRPLFPTLPLGRSPCLNDRLGCDPEQLHTRTGGEILKNRTPGTTIYEEEPASWPICHKLDNQQRCSGLIPNLFLDDTSTDSDNISFRSETLDQEPSARRTNVARQ